MKYAQKSRSVSEDRTPMKSESESRTPLRKADLSLKEQLNSSQESKQRRKRGDRSHKSGSEAPSFRDDHPKGELNQVEFAVTERIEPELHQTSQFSFAKGDNQGHTESQEAPPQEPTYSSRK